MSLGQDIGKNGRGAQGEGEVKRLIVMLDVYTGHEEWLDWIDVFECCADVNY